MTLASPTRSECTEISPSASAIGWARRKCLMSKIKQSLFSVDDNRISCEDIGVEGPVTRRQNKYEETIHHRNAGRLSTRDQNIRHRKGGAKQTARPHRAGNHRGHPGQNHRKTYRQMNKAAQALGRLAKGVPKNFSAAELARRRKLMAGINSRREKSKQAKSNTKTP